MAGLALPPLPRRAGDRVWPARRPRIRPRRWTTRPATAWSPPTRRRPTHLPARGAGAGGRQLAWRCSWLTAGQTIRCLRPLSLLSPRARSYGSGPNAFQVNRTAAAAGITTSETGPGWRLELVGVTAPRRSCPGPNSCPCPSSAPSCRSPASRAGRPCSVGPGFASRDLARLVGVDHPAGAHVESLERRGAFAQASLSGQQVRAGETLLALRVNGADLSPDHGTRPGSSSRPRPGCTTPNGWRASLSPDGVAEWALVSPPLRGRSAAPPGAGRLLAFAGYVATRILAGPKAVRILVWFAGAAVAHDLVLWPLYAIADRAPALAARRHPERLPERAVDQPRASADGAVRGGLLAVSFPSGVPLVGADLSRRLRPDRVPLPGTLAASHRCGVRVVGGPVRASCRAGYGQEKVMTWHASHLLPDDDGSAGHRNTTAMSRSVLSVPFTVPLTLLRPSFEDVPFSRVLGWTDFVEGRRVAWLPAVQGKSPPGHLWAWELEPLGPSRTLVIPPVRWSVGDRGGRA